MCPPLTVIQSRLQALSERLQREFHVAELHVFGSVARDEAGPGSDLDILVDFVDTQGPNVVEVPEHRAWFAIRMAATNILLLVDSYKSMPACDQASSI
ncbi:MAG TPA: nucleotidyltransferase domain-containing protein [Polyangiaceae bacterium]